MLILDTSGLIAAYSRTDSSHGAVSRFLNQNQETLAVSPYVMAELDYLLTSRPGTRVARRFFEDLMTGPFEVVVFGESDLRTAVAVMDRYGDQEIGVTDASLVVLADRFKIRDILTFDYRHFDTSRPLRGGGRFRLMPRDWDDGDA